MSDTDGPEDPPDPPDPPSDPPPEGPPGDPPQLGVIEGGKKYRGGGSPKARISRAEYDLMVDLYVKGRRTVYQIVKEGKVSKETARKAINRGWPERGWLPLKTYAEAHDREVDRIKTTVPSDPALAKEAEDWTELRRGHLKAARSLRELVDMAVIRLEKALKESTALVMKPRRRVYFEEVFDGDGKLTRRIPRTLTEDVEHVPNLLAVVASLADVAQVLKNTGTHEIGMANSRDPAGMERKPGWSALTPEQMAYIRENGRPPPGVSLEQLDQG